MDVGFFSVGLFFLATPLYAVVVVDFANPHNSSANNSQIRRSYNDFVLRLGM